MLQNIFFGLSLGAVYSLVAVGFALVFNILKFSNFSHGGVMSFTAYAGCDLSLGTCTSKFSNRIHFRGQPFIPSPVVMLG